MKQNPLRVALFTDSFHEANGIGTLSRQFAEFARTRNLPFCCVHAGRQTHAIQEGSLLTLELKRSAASFPMDAGLYFDLLLNRHRNWVLKQLQDFKPDLIHITGPGDLGILGFWVSNTLKLPMAASWHTNLHEYAARRLGNILSFAPDNLRRQIGGLTQDLSLRALAAFYRLAHFVVAPNRSMVEELAVRTGRPSYLMSHGVDTNCFSPARRARTDATFRIGYVGRLTPEKDVRAFAAIERKLLAAGWTDFRFVLVGEGSEREWLRKNLKSCDLTGILRGDDLASAFANMDAFVFPSKTDTFGLVVLEAMASGVPVITNHQTGLRAGVQHGVTGYLGDNYGESLLQLMSNREVCREMSSRARAEAVSRGWCQVFTDLYATYDVALEQQAVRRRMTPKPPLQ